MNRLIYKYPLHEYRGELKLHEGAYPLTVQIDQKTGIPSVWIIVDLDEPECTRKFQLVGTGSNPPEWPALYVGTYQKGPFVWHLFIEIQ